MERQMFQATNGLPDEARIGPFNRPLEHRMFQAADRRPVDPRTAAFNRPLEHGAFQTVFSGQAGVLA
jgi:hypothetical protein